MKELPKAYDPKLYEDGIYKRWEDSGFFNPDNIDGEPYSIAMPPPNVTGVLHLGHALENALMDTMARFQRMCGKKVLLLPGTDHAAVATQAKVEKLLIEQGIKHPREELGREKLLEKIREYSEQSKSTILKQIKKMGTSADWSRLAYTFDETRGKAVDEMFVRMYNDGLIYRGFRVVNWSVRGQSTCSDDELVYVERSSKLYTFRYSKDFPISIATTRPETKLGDTAVAVHPDDPRYQEYIGQVFTADVGADKPLSIKIIADSGIDMRFGTGALGVTPAHSPIDFEMYERQKIDGNPIGLVQVIGTNGQMTSAAGPAYAGLSVMEAREKFVLWLSANSLLEKEEEIVQNVGTSDRFGDVVEALPMTQWFVAVNKEITGRNKTLKELMREAVTIGHQGDPEKKIRITPDRFEKTYLYWIDNLRDWCISRQIWWGHRIPVWYRGKEIYCDVESPTGDGWEQDPDTLDTWFSSGLWTFSTLGWPDKTKDLAAFHPTSWMQMGHEILFFWMARMILMSTYALDQIPFRDVYIHGMVRDEHGKKFSKSAGNGIDPIEVIEKYGCDALRMSVLSGITPGNDSRFYLEKIEGARNLVNKLWNISRFILSNVAEISSDNISLDQKTLPDRWIFERLENIVSLVDSSIKNYDFSFASEKLREFTWTEFADEYIEDAKIKGGKDAILVHILETLLKLWHPFMPFVTEKIWQDMGKKNLLMVEKMPQSVYAEGEQNLTKVNLDYLFIQGIRTGILNIRNEYKISPKEKIKKVIIFIPDDNQCNLLEENKILIQKRAKVEGISIVKDVKELAVKGWVRIVCFGATVYIDLSGIINIEKEKARLQKEIDFAAPYVRQLEQKLANKAFVDNAPKELVEAEKKKLAEAKEKLTKLRSQLKSLF